MRTTPAVLLLLGASGCIVVQAPPQRPVAVEPPAPPPPSEVVYEAPPEPEPAQSVYVDPPYDEPPPIAVRYLPPPMRYEPPPPMPVAGMHWVGGYWIWDDGEWEWMSGHWVLPPRPEYLWVAPYYEVRGPVVIFVAGHWGPPGYVFRPPPPTIQVVVVEARPSYRGTLVVHSDVRGGCFVPAPPGSRPGIVVPAPVGTPPQVVVSAPPVVRPGMVVRGAPDRNEGFHRVTVVAPAGVTRTGEPLQADVPARPSLAASLPPRAAVAPPRPPARAVEEHPAAFSPVAVRPPAPGQRERLPQTVTPHPTAQSLEPRPGAVAPPHPGGLERREPAPLEPAHPGRLDRGVEPAPGTARTVPGTPPVQAAPPPATPAPLPRRDEAGPRTIVRPQVEPQVEPQARPQAQPQVREQVQPQVREQREVRRPSRAAPQGEQAKPPEDDKKREGERRRGE